MTKKKLYDIPIERNIKLSTNNVQASCEPVESQVERIRRRVDDMEEKQAAILSYLENIMGGELVRNVRNSRRPHPLEWTCYLKNLNS